MKKPVVEFLILVMRIVPKNLVSYILGSVSRLTLPKIVMGPINSFLVALFNIDMSEAEKILEDYDSFEDVFTRRLKEGAREISGPVCSPADGVLSFSQETDADRAIQAKGLTYSVEELVFGASGREGREFDPAWYSTIYLAPHNYHRVHSPISGKITDITYIRGELWPVNQPFVRYLPFLFTRNERLVFHIQTSSGARVDVVMVGATNVGRIETAFLPNLVTNSLPRQIGMVGAIDKYKGLDLDIEFGDELGTFLLGSTVVIVYDKKFADQHSLMRLEDSMPIMMGQSLLKNDVKS